MSPVFGSAAVAAPAGALPAPAVPMSTASDSSHLVALRMHPPLGIAKVGLNLSARGGRHQTPARFGGSAGRRPAALRYRRTGPARHGPVPQAASSSSSPVNVRHSSA
ncbi:hypothetical protein San01_21220 [Streptomyces angustmyceticus]|uniref:Uncharacterized protein n=1 Tax=Streptomyces angustmyceticus TaxID=285578 RepID=A0A5J4LHG5_9ACTN|nr:hypothetical protein San01_21220 [Streptomyces angustmyceticus]